MLLGFGADSFCGVGKGLPEQEPFVFTEVLDDILAIRVRDGVGFRCIIVS